MKLIGPAAENSEHSRMDQRDLAILCCEGLVNSVIASRPEEIPPS